MQTNLMSSASTWDSSLGCFISDAHVHLAAVLHDYNPHFSLVFIPPKDRDATDTKPWAILDSSPARPPYIMRYLSDEEMKRPSEVLSWIFEGDLSKHRPSEVFDKIRSREAAEALLKMKREEEELEDRLEFGKYVFGDTSPNYFKHNGRRYRK